MTLYMAKKIGPPFKIIPDSIIKATSGGYLYCQTDPVHPSAEKRPDRKARYVYLHRVILENHLGRLLQEGEEPHHIDGDPTNNVPSNLTIKDTGEHQRDHANTDNPFWKHSPRTKPRKKKADLLRAFALILSAPH